MAINHKVHINDTEVSIVSIQTVMLERTPAYKGMNHSVEGAGNQLSQLLGRGSFGQAAVKK